MPSGRKRIGGPEVSGGKLDPRYGPLTQRELEVVELILEGCDNLSIATRLGISEETAKHHLYNIFGKKNVLTRLDLAVTILKERHAAELAALRAHCCCIDLQSN